MNKQLGLIFIPMLILLACQQPAKLNHIERNGFLMDTVIRISFYDSRSSDLLETWADSLFKLLSA